MLLAEINGKRCPEVEGLEDMITSAVFGQLRQIEPPQFWPAFFRRARTVQTPARSLHDVLLSLKIDPSLYDKVAISFWSQYSNYGEPDLLIHFTGDTVRPLSLVVEVKLNSGKSGSGEYDQLARYLALLDDLDCMGDQQCEPERRFLIYLTRRFAANDIDQSIAIYDGKRSLFLPSSLERMFGLEWNDILEIAQDEKSESSLLGELSQFLRRRGFEKFCGFIGYQNQVVAHGSFYQSTYFDNARYQSRQCSLRGNFYER